MTAKLTNNHIALLLLDCVEGLGIRRKNRILDEIGEPSRLLEDDNAVRSAFIRIAGAELFSAFTQSVKENKAAEIVEKLDGQGIVPVIYSDLEFPERLSELYDRPLLLYCKGNVGLLQSKCISVVGTRRPTRYGINVTREFVTAFAQAGLTTVSGFARGIDTAAHKAAFELDCPTIAVVANGVDQIYPAENRALYERVLETNGLFVSEYKPGTHAAPFNFPERNRIISGLSQGLFVPEAGEKSGTLITVNHAVEQHRDIFVIPGNLNSPASVGTNRILRDMQSTIVLEPSDVLINFGIYPQKAEKATYQMTISERQIIEALEVGETHVEELIELTGLSLNELNSVLLTLEINDMIEKTPGNHYILK